MTFTTVARIREPYGRLSFTCFAIHPFSGAILAAVGGNKPVARPRRGIPRQTINFGYVREFAGANAEVQREIGNHYNLEHKATIRQVEFHRQLVYTLGTEDYVKIWDYLTVSVLFYRKTLTSKNYIQGSTETNNRHSQSGLPRKNGADRSGVDLLGLWGSRVSRSTTDYKRHL